MVVAAWIREYRRVRIFVFHLVSAAFRIGGLGSVTCQLVAQGASRSPQAVHGIDLNHNSSIRPVGRIVVKVNLIRVIR